MLQLTIYSALYCPHNWNKTEMKLKRKLKQNSFDTFWFQFRFSFISVLFQ